MRIIHKATHHEIIVRINSNAAVAVRNFERLGVSRTAGMVLSGHLTASIYSRYSIIDSAMPFGGYKQSGFGREGSRHVIDLFTQIKSVYVKL